MSHGFFASYATLDNKSKYLQKVVLDLRERLRTRLGAADEAKLGFFAVFDGILTAQAWEDELSDAVRHAQVIVLFCSNTYFNSEYCAKEFDVFRRRLKDIKPEPEVIVPVIWDLCTMPKAVARYQASHLAAMPEEYRNHGLLALRRNKTTRTRYDATLDALTGVLERLLNQPALAPLDPPVPFDMLLDAFDNPDCYSVRIGALHRDGLRWQQRYERAFEREHHDHLMCAPAATRWSNFTSTRWRRYSATADSFGFSLTGHVHQLLGTSSVCRKARIRARPRSRAGWVSVPGFGSRLGAAPFATDGGPGARARLGWARQKPRLRL